MHVWEAVKVVSAKDVSCLTRRTNEAFLRAPGGGRNVMISVTLPPLTTAASSCNKEVLGGFSGK